jgi:ABC-type dipeptide/oligopeptide/nickel transport system permease component
MEYEKYAPVSESSVKPVVKSAAGNALSFFITLVSLAFLIGIPLGKAARDFSASMLTPDVPVSDVSVSPHVND